MSVEQNTNTKPGHTYIAQLLFSNGVGGPIKIGKAHNVEKRLATLQTACPYKVVLVATIEGSDLEARLHERCHSHRLNGEWFAPCQEVDDLVWLLGGRRLVRWWSQYPSLNTMLDDPTLYALYDCIRCADKHDVPGAAAFLNAFQSRIQQQHAKALEALPDLSIKGEA